MNDLTDKCKTHGQFYILTNYMGGRLAFLYSNCKLTIYWLNYKISWFRWNISVDVELYNPNVLGNYEMAQNNTTQDEFDNICIFINSQIGEQIYADDAHPFYAGLPENIARWIKD